MSFDSTSIISLFGRPDLANSAYSIKNGFLELDLIMLVVSSAVLLAFLEKGFYPFSKVYFRTYVFSVSPTINFKFLPSIELFKDSFIFPNLYSSMKELNILFSNLIFLLFIVES